MPMSQRFPEGAKKGFTLVELLVVLVVMALGAMLLAGRPAGNDGMASLEAKAELKASIVQMRADAIESGDPKSILFENSGYRLRPSIGANEQALLFWPDGSSNGGVIVDAWDRPVITIDWKTGRTDDAS